MKIKKDEFKNNQIVIYKTDKGPEIQVKLGKDSVWLDAHLIASLFDVNRPAIVKHIKNIYETKELKRKLTCSILEQVAADGKIRKMNLYNLDMIISVGYRVNSRRATQFRIWATKTLKNHLIKGYTINEKRLIETQKKFKELQDAISFLQNKSKHRLLTGREQEIISLIFGYSKSLTLLEQYDQNKIKIIKTKKAEYVFEYSEALKIIFQLKKELINKKEASELFGQEYQNKLEGIIGNLYQTFGGQELYKSVEEKSSHLLYLIIKDHPFTDGNKRIASFLFIYFLSKNNFLYRESGEKKINDNALIALCLLIAVSDPKEKDTMIKIITNLLQ